MHRLLWLIPLALISLAMWLPSLIPAGVLAIIGWAFLSLAGVVAVLLFIMHGFAEAMRP